MRFATGVVADSTRSGVVTDAGFHLLDRGRTVDDLVVGGLPALLAEGAVAAQRAPVPVADVVWHPPLRPASVRDFVTFESHVEGVRRSIDGAAGVPESWYDAPTFYFTNPHAIVGAGVPIARPAGCRALDFELEVAAVLGGPLVADGATSLTETAAAQAIVGYTLFNDWSARDIQAREMKTGLGPAKGKDFASSLGPWLVTADEFTDLHDAEGFLDVGCTVEVNGVQVGADRLTGMGWTFATMVAYASRDSVVVAGDVLASGTTGGGGCLAELWGRNGSQQPPPLEPGDVVTLTADRLGRLTTTIVQGEPWPELTGFRPRPSAQP